jgi:flagellar FliL protein
MAEKTTESRNGGRLSPTGEEGAAAASAAPRASGAAKTWLPLVITVVSMPLLAYATTKFVLVPQMKRALQAPAAVSAAAPAEKAAGDEPARLLDGTVKVTVQMNKVLVNVAGTMGTRYLMTSITLAGSDPELKEKINQNKDQLQDLATSALSTKTIAELEKPSARNEIRAELTTIFNNALGGPFIKEIYITEMAIQ